MIFNTAGPTNADTTKSSANLEMIDVKEMGLQCLLMTWTGLFFFFFFWGGGGGYHYACFQDGGNCCPAMLQLKMEVTGWAIMSAYSLSTQLSTSYTVGTRSLAGIQLAERRQDIDFRKC